MVTLGTWEYCAQELLLNTIFSYNYHEIISFLFLSYSYKVGRISYNPAVSGLMSPFFFVVLSSAANMVREDHQMHVSHHGEQNADFYIFGSHKSSMSHNLCFSTNLRINFMIHSTSIPRAFPREIFDFLNIIREL